MAQKVQYDLEIILKWFRFKSVKGKRNKSSSKFHLQRKGELNNTALIPTPSWLRGQRM